jgi:spermidine synthase
MVRIATNPKKFSFLSRCTPDARIILGDARLSLSNHSPQSFHILAVDAFSSDSVPMHLLTHEALGVYARVLKPGGILMMHISNRYLDLEPVLAEGAKSGGWHAAMLEHNPNQRYLNDHASSWVALTRDAQTLRDLKDASAAPMAWRPLKTRRDFSGWTDDYASTLPLLEFAPMFKELQFK